MELVIFSEMDSQIRQMENRQKEYESKIRTKSQQLLSEISDMSRNLPRMLSEMLFVGIRQLHHLFEVLPTELRGYEGDLSTSFENVENQIEKYISECLGYSPEQTANIQEILTLVKDYKVVQLLPGKRHSVSLERVHSILQDNFSNSSLCGLFNILLAGYMDSETKVITFF